MSDVVDLGRLDQLPDPGSKGYLIGNTSLFAVRQDTRVFVYRNRCPHLGIELEWLPDQFLDTQQQFIQCSTHGALFLIESGECISGPCVGEHLEPLHAEIKNGHIHVTLPEVAESPESGAPA